jgi:hypothetical protein
VKLHAYVLAGDPAWAAQSLSSYYHLVDRVVVSFDADKRSWTGHPLMVDEAVAALKSADPDHKIRWLPGAHSFPERAALEVETEQRQAALEAASDGSEWVLQLDTDEIVQSPSALISHVERADRRNAGALDFPLRDFYQAAGPGRFLEHCGRFWRVQARLPGPGGGPQRHRALTLSAGSSCPSLSSRPPTPQHGPRPPLGRTSSRGHLP